MTLKWISVYDRLPRQYDQPVIVDTDDPSLGYQVAMLTRYGDLDGVYWILTFNQEGIETQTCKVTHWAQIPNGPNGETPDDEL